MLEMPYKVPTHYNGKRIKMRIPYTISGEREIDANTSGIQFPEATFQQSVDKPFEVWDVKLAASQLDANGNPIAPPAPNINKWWRVRLQDGSKSHDLTKNAQLVDTLVDTDANIWFWRIPYTIIRGEGFIVVVDNLLPGNVLRAEITFRGFQLILAPPSNTR